MKSNSRWGDIDEVQLAPEQKEYLMACWRRCGTNDCGNTFRHNQFLCRHTHRWRNTSAISGSDAVTRKIITRPRVVDKRISNLGAP